MTEHRTPTPDETPAVYCLACHILSPDGSDVTTDGELICPSCRSIDCYPIRIPDGYELCRRR
jgi:hypothetical protein